MSACMSCGSMSVLGGASLVGGKKGKKMESDSKADVYKKAQKYNIKGRSKMNKTQLISAVRNAQKAVGNAIARRTKKTTSYSPRT